MFQVPWAARVHNTSDYESAKYRGRFEYAITKHTAAQRF